MIVALLLNRRRKNGHNRVKDVRGRELIEKGSREERREVGKVTT